MPFNLPDTWPWVRQQGESADWVTAYNQMAALERLYGASYGLRRSHGLRPELLTGELPEAVRWCVGVVFTDHGQQDAGQTGQDHRGGLRYHKHQLRVFVAMANHNARMADSQARSDWVPLCWDTAYANNRTLDGACRMVRFTGQPVWATQPYGRLKGITQFWDGWLFPMELVLTYIIGAA